ncbi:Hpt domain-containing protein [Auraticoccus monumenti]|uniref:Hpt domain-containing protein n=1 Tax=Auraticoccus monumenti TaxID=675864 RepID=UPI0012FA44A7|nr:Hpt domain-containing protein [Auraticoccus monumenti]
MSEDPFAAVLARIAGEARQTNLRRADHLEEALSRLSEGRLDEEGRQRAVRAAHQLAGSAGTFGHQRAGELARRIEQFLAAPQQPTTVAEALAVVAECRSELAQG